MQQFTLCYYGDLRGSYGIFFCCVGIFWDSKHPSGGMPPPPPPTHTQMFCKAIALRLNLVGFGSLAGYHKFVFKPPPIILCFYDVRNSRGKTLAGGWGEFQLGL